MFLGTTKIKILQGYKKGDYVMDKKSFLVTGGAGFIGSHIVEILVEQGHDVVVLDDFSTGNMKNIEPFVKEIAIVKKDIRDFNSVEKAFKGVDYVIHQAAIRSVPLSCDDPVTTNDVNITGTLNVLMAARKHNVKRVVYASSSSVYGDTTKFPQSEEDATMPVSPYAVSKLGGEYYCRSFFKIYGLETVSLRYFNVFGPRQDPQSKYAAVIPGFLMRILGGKNPEVHGDGLQTRDFTYVKNVAWANVNSATKPGVGGMVINVAMGNPKSVLDVLNEINKILGTSFKPEFTPVRKGDVRATCADVSKLSRVLDMKKAVGFEDGMKSTVEWFSKEYKKGCIK